MYKTKPRDIGHFYSAGVLVSRSQTNLHASYLLIDMIISKTIDKHWGSS